MATEDQPDRRDETTALDIANLGVPGTGDIAPAVDFQPVSPRGMPEAEQGELQSQAAELARRLAEASGSQELELVDRISYLGVQAQRSAGSELELLRSRVGELAGEQGPGSNVANDLAELRLTLNQINPHDQGRHGIWSRILSMVPLLGGSDLARRTLEKLALRYEPVSQQVSIIEDRLQEGRRMLAGDNIELRKLYQQLEVQQASVQRNAYLGELLMQELNALLEETTDAPKAERLRNVLHDVSVRVQDLRTMEAVYNQFFVSIEMNRQNNTRLGQAVERTLSLATNVVTVGLAIQMALARQQRVLEANQRTREFLGNIVVSNAEAIKQHTEAIGDAYNSPLIAMEKIAQAHDDLMTALDTADRLRDEGIASARENLARLAQLSGALQERSRALLEPGKEQTGSVEA
jgi:uncharacterized protein YaaN involved in tellurite resistance